MGCFVKISNTDDKKKHPERCFFFDFGEGVITNHETFWTYGNGDFEHEIRLPDP